MTIHILPALLVAILGAVVFLIAKNSDVKELAKHAWWTGLLVTLYYTGTVVAATTLH
jgi:uncharacterized membrane protein YhaH (DUF805 family)